MREVVRASAFAGFAELVAGLGGDLKQIATAAHLGLPSFERPDEFISSRDLNLLLNAAAAQIKHADLGLRWGGLTDLTVLGPLHIAMMHSDTARDAIDLASLYLHVHSPIWEVTRTPIPKRDEDLVAMRCLMQRPPPMMQMFERNMVVLHRALTEICNGKYQPVEVWFQHPRQSPLHVYRRAFGVAPEFTRQQSGIVVRRKALAAYRPGRNRQLLEMAEMFLRAQTPPTGSSITTDVTGMIRILIESEDCAPAHVASALGMHERTLQRKLQAEGASFEQIKDGVRRDLAVALLGDPDVQISRIAYKLHYTNPSAFTRACQRWHRLSPREIRQKLVEGRPLKALKAA